MGFNSGFKGLILSFLSFFISPCVLIPLLLKILNSSASFNTAVSAVSPYVLHCNRNVLCTELQDTAATVFLYRINRLFLLTEERCILGTIGT